MTKKLIGNPIPLPEPGTYPEWWSINDVAQNYHVAFSTARIWMARCNIPTQRAPGSSGIYLIHAPTFVAAIEAGLIRIASNRAHRRTRPPTTPPPPPATPTEDYNARWRRVRAMCDRWHIPYQRTEVAA